MPQLGWLQHDDGLYLVGAKSFATGQGHRIISLPGSPWQTKYPPLYPLLLSVVWRVWPDFPENLKLATVLSWLFLPPLLLLVRVLYRRYGFRTRWVWLLIGCLALNPYMALFSRSLLSELPFTVLLLGVFLTHGRSAAIAGLLAGLAFLTRTAGLPLLIVMPAWFAMKREFRNAAIFATVMLIFVSGWTLWAGQHRPGLIEPYLMYYLDYVGYELFNVTPQNFHLYVWRNVDAILTALAVPVLPIAESIWTKILAQTIGVAMIIGVYRLAKEREQVRPYAIFGALFCGMLAVWHYPPNGRFLFPLFPLALAGFWVQMSQLGNAIRRAWNDPKQKSAAIIFASVIGVLVAVTLQNNWELMFEVSPSSDRHERSMTTDTLACANRIAAEIPPGASVVSDNDLLVFLLTGRRSMRFHSHPIYWYEGRLDDMVKEALRLPQVAREHGMQYVFLNRRFQAGLGDDRFSQSIGSSPDLRAMFRCGEATMYEIRQPLVSATPASRGTD